MTRWCRAYGAASLVVAGLDLFWSGWIARDFYIHEIGVHLADRVSVWPLTGFYIGYPALLVTLVVTPAPPQSAGAAALRAALVGLAAYGTYNLTVLAWLRDWSVSLAVLDLSWGVLGSAVAGMAAFVAVDEN